MNKINTPKGKIPTRVTYEPSIWLYTLSLGWNRVRTANKSWPELCLVGLFSAVVQVKRVWSFSRCTAGLSKWVNVSALSGASILTRGEGTYKYEECEDKKEPCTDRLQWEVLVFRISTNMHVQMHIYVYMYILMDVYAYV